MTSDGWELVYTFRLPEPTILLNRWQRMHWARKKRYSADVAWTVLVAIGQAPRVPLQEAWIHVVRGNPKPFPDQDGLIGGLKPLLDLLSMPRGFKKVGYGFIVDDDPKHLKRLTAEAVVAPRGEGYTIVNIYRPAALARAA